MKVLRLIWMNKFYFSIISIQGCMQHLQKTSLLPCDLLEILDTIVRVVLDLDIKTKIRFIFLYGKSSRLTYRWEMMAFWAIHNRQPNLLLLPLCLYLPHIFSFYCFSLLFVLQDKKPWGPEGDQVNLRYPIATTHSHGSLPGVWGFGFSKDLAGVSCVSRSRQNSFGVVV